MAHLALTRYETVADYKAPQPQKIPDAWRGVLNGMRLIALQCRAEARTDLFEACRLIPDPLQGQGDGQGDVFSLTLIRGLRPALMRQPVFYRPGVDEMSFDESWLIAALGALDKKDWDSFDFLIRSRVVPAHRRSIRFLLHGIIRQGRN